MLICNSFKYLRQASLTLDESNMNASNLGDISTDDNAVDMEIKQEDDPTSIGLTSSNDRIPILDDDDDVIVLPQEEPVIEEIPDDDDHQAKNTSESKENSTNEAESGSAVAITSQDTGISTQPDNEDNKGLFQVYSCVFVICLEQSSVS